MTHQLSTDLIFIGLPLPAQHACRSCLQPRHIQQTVTDVPITQPSLNTLALKLDHGHIGTTQACRATPPLQGAWELSVPPIHGRFYSASVLDPYQVSRMWQALLPNPRLVHSTALLACTRASSLVACVLLACTVIKELRVNCHLPAFLLSFSWVGCAMRIDPAPPGLPSCSVLPDFGWLRVQVMHPSSLDCDWLHAQ